MKGITECSCELTQFVQCKCLEFQSFCIYSFYHLPHRCNCIFPVEDDPADSHFPENFDCLPVHFSGFTAEMDLAGYAFLSQVQNQCRIGKDEAVESDFHTLFHNVCNLFILFRNIIERIRLSEAVEAIEPGPVEGIRATGANKLEEILYGVLPQVMPLLISYSLYRFESNVRSATVVGMVGAGGIGVTLWEAIRGFQFQQTCALMVLIIVTVSLLDFLSQRLRKHFI